MKFISIAIAWLVGAAIATFQVHNAEEVQIHIQQGEVVCRSVLLPLSSVRVIIRASVVGLTGNPNLFGGWDENEIRTRVQTSLAPVNAGGYHVMSEYADVPRDKTSYFLCVTTFSTQGSDFVLTALITDPTSWLVPPISILDSFPVVWRLDTKGEQNFVDFVLTVPLESRNLVISVTPLYGEVNLRVFRCDAWNGESLAVSAVKGPDILSVNLPTEMEKVCIRVMLAEGFTYMSEFSLSASLNADGPFLAQSIPIAGSSGITRNFRVYVNGGTDLSVTLRGSSDLFVKAEGTNGGTDENGMGTGQRLEISRKNFHDGIKILYLSVFSSSSRESSFILSATAHGTVEDLTDGEPLEVTVEGENRYRDFRIFVPSEVNIVVIQADSSQDGSGLGLFASSVRTSHDPRGYKWNSMKGTNEIVLIREKHEEEEIDGIIDCSDCYIYISVKSCIVVNGHCAETSLLPATSKYILSASSDTATSTVYGNIFQRFFMKNKTKVLRMPSSKEGEGKIYVYLYFKGGAKTLRYSFEEKGGSSSECVDDSFCLIVIDKDVELLFLENTSSLFWWIEIGIRSESEGIWLKNHHAVWLPARVEGKFNFLVPSGDDLNGIIRHDGGQETIMTVCNTKTGDCQDGEKTSWIKLESSTLFSIHFICGSLKKCTITPSFYSLVANSLRVGFKPVTALIYPENKISWQVGFSQVEEWLLVVSSSAENDGKINLCVQDIDRSRCCSVPCSQQGFGRQDVWVENFDKECLVTLTSEPLVHLEENKAINIKDRKSMIFGIQASDWPAKIVTDSGSVNYMLNSPESEVLSDFPDDRKSFVFAKVDKTAKTALLLRRHSLKLNEWVMNASWLISGNTDDNSPQFFIRVERCYSNSFERIFVNGNEMYGNFIDCSSSADEIAINSSPNEPFRAAFLERSKIVEDLKFNENKNFLLFKSPINSAGSLYRALCFPSELSTQCEIEKSQRTIYGDPVACEAESVCSVPVSESCSKEWALTVVADKGPGYGIFTPVNTMAQPYRSVSVGFLWFIFKVFLGIVLCKFAASKIVLLRVLLNKMIYKWPRRVGDLENGYYRMMGGTEMSNSRSNR